MLTLEGNGCGLLCGFAVLQKLPVPVFTGTGLRSLPGRVSFGERSSKVRALDAGVAGPSVNDSAGENAIEPLPAHILEKGPPGLLHSLVCGVAVMIL